MAGINAGINARSANRVDVGISTSTRYVVLSGVPNIFFILTPNTLTFYLGPLPPVGRFGTRSNRVNSSLNLIRRATRQAAQQSGHLRPRSYEPANIFENWILDRVRQRSQGSGLLLSPSVIFTFFQLEIADILHYRYGSRTLFLIDDANIIEYHNPDPLSQGLADNVRTDRRTVYSRVTVENIQGNALVWLRVLTNGALIRVSCDELPPRQPETVDLQRYILERTRPEQTVAQIATSIMLGLVDLSPEAERQAAHIVGVRIRDDRTPTPGQPASQITPWAPNVAEGASNATGDAAASSASSAPAPFPPSVLTRAAPGTTSSPLYPSDIEFNMNVPQGPPLMLRWTGPEYQRINRDFDPLDPAAYGVNNIPDAPRPSTSNQYVAPLPAASSAENAEDPSQAAPHGEQDPMFFEEALAAMDQTIDHVLFSAPESPRLLAGDRVPIDPELENLGPLQADEDIDFAELFGDLVDFD